MSSEVQSKKKINWTDLTDSSDNDSNSGENNEAHEIIESPERHEAQEEPMPSQDHEHRREYRPKKYQQRPKNRNFNNKPRKSKTDIEQEILARETEIELLKKDKIYINLYNLPERQTISEQDVYSMFQKGVVEHVIHLIQNIDFLICSKEEAKRIMRQPFMRWNGFKLKLRLSRRNSLENKNSQHHTNVAEDRIKQLQQESTENNSRIRGFFNNKKKSSDSEKQPSSEDQVIASLQRSSASSLGDHVTKETTPLEEMDSVENTSTQDNIVDQEPLEETADKREESKIEENLRKDDVLISYTGPSIGNTEDTADNESNKSVNEEGIKIQEPVERKSEDFGVFKEERNEEKRGGYSRNYEGGYRGGSYNNYSYYGKNSYASYNGKKYNGNGSGNGYYGSNYHGSQTASYYKKSQDYYYDSKSRYYDNGQNDYRHSQTAFVSNHKYGNDTTQNKENASSKFTKADAKNANYQVTDNSKGSVNKGNQIKNQITSAEANSKVKSGAVKTQSINIFGILESEDDE